MGNSAEIHPIAHVHPGSVQLTHPLEDHAEAVARMAEKMAGEFGAGDWGRLAGLWHDLGNTAMIFNRTSAAGVGMKHTSLMQLLGKSIIRVPGHCMPKRNLEN